MASAPIPATTQRAADGPPAATPVAVPSGALVFFSCANSFVLWLSGNNTDTSALEKRSRTRSSTALSACSTVR
jgi:hypothetical protein